MDPARRRQRLQLGVLGVLLAAIVWFVLLPAVSPPAVATGPVAATGPAGSPKVTGRPAEVRLEALARAGAARDDVSVGARRNPFRMGAATAPATVAMGGPVRPMPPPIAPVTVPIGPPPVPPPPPIPYRFIGVLSGAPGQGRIAVLTDGRTVVHGGVNQVIEGRYRIVQIGEESVQVEHADGRGRQTLRLLGQ